jgi:glycolate oxidase subunit GlcD
MADYEGIPAAVVKPSSESDVIKLVKFADRTRTPIVARGAGSSLTGAAVLHGAIILDMREMNKILKVDTVNWYVQTEPGISLDDLNVELKKHGFFFPPDPASSYICTVGGAIAEGSGGLKCVKYGTMKDWVISLRVVLPNGEVARFGEPLAKNRAGYDLVHLMVGSEGTLGIITEAHLKIIPVPAVPIRRLLVTFGDWESVSKTINALKRAGIMPNLFEFMDRENIAALNQKLEQNLEEAEATLLLDVEEQRLEAVVGILNSSGARRITIAQNEEEAENMYQVRAMAYLAVKSLASGVQVEDVAIPIDKLAEYFQLVKSIAAKYKLRIPVNGHAGDGNVHPLILFDKDDSQSRARATSAFEEICRYAISVGGSITGEHGVGVQKSKFLREQLVSHDGREALRLMKEIKKLFDPKGIMNPGKYVEAA